MKVIDLLNKLYNMEEVPKKIKIGCSHLTLNKNKDNYIYENRDEYYGDELIHWYDLDTKVEIIEDKKIDKIKNMNTDGKHKNWEFEKLSKEEITLDIQTLRHKLDEIIDYLEEKEC